MHLKQGNHPSIALNKQKVLAYMTKEVKHKYAFALPIDIAGCIPNLFVSPQHLLQNDGKSNCLIFDAKKRYTADSTPINMMTTTAANGKLKCEYGTVLRDILTRAWNLQIPYPNQDICIHANNVAGTFRQLKTHPDCMPALLCMVAEFIFFQCGLAFGADFSPAN